MFDAVLFAELDEGTAKLWPAIRFQFPQETDLAKPSQKDLADSFGCDRPQSSYPRISGEPIHHDDIMNGRQFKQVRGDFVEGK